MVIDNSIEKFSRAPKSVRYMIVIGALLVSFVGFIAIFGSLVAPYNPLEIVDDGLLPPSINHLMGTDKLGRDVMSRILIGSRNSLGVAFLAVTLMTIVGTTLGSISGYFGSALDRVLLMAMDALRTFPSFLLALIISLLFGTGVLNTAVAVAITGIVRYFTVIRSLTLTIKQRGFVESAKAIGCSPLYIVRHHIIPYYTSSIVVLSTLGASRAILVIGGLGFLGLGLPIPTPEWGTDLAMGRSVVVSGIWWLTAFPGLMIFISVLGFNLLGEGLNLIMNPKERGQ